MKKYEYVFISTYQTAWPDVINSYASKGWRIISTVSPGKSFTSTVIMEREVQDEKANV